MLRITMKIFYPLGLLGYYIICICQSCLRYHGMTQLATANSENAIIGYNILTKLIFNNLIFTATKCKQQLLPIIQNINLHNKS